jgi:hypothetical protein
LPGEGWGGGPSAKMSDPANYLGLSEVMVDRVLAVTSQTIP